MSDSETKVPDVQDLLPKPIPPTPPIPEGMDPFTMFRTNDESGVSGTGKIGQGVLFANGKVCFQFLCPPAAGDTQIKDSMDDFLNIHVRSHPTNKTIITFSNGRQLHFPEKTEEI